MVERAPPYWMSIDDYLPASELCFLSPALTEQRPQNIETLRNDSSLIAPWRRMVSWLFSTFTTELGGRL